MPPGRGGMFAFLLIVLNGVNFPNFASHAKIGYFADTHFVDQHILQLDVSMYVAHGVVNILKTPHDLPEHRAYVVVREGGASVALEDIEQGAGGAILGDEVIGVAGVIDLEQGKDVFVME